MQKLKFSKFLKISRYILKIISYSKIPEDYPHAINTYKWLKKISGNFFTDYMKIAAISHDIERALPNLRVKKENFKNYNEYKKAHANNSAKIMDKILTNFYFPNDFKTKVVTLIKNHEFGGDFESDLLKDADSLSFFDINIHFFKKRESIETVITRAKWGIERLSENAKKILKDENLNLIRFKNGLVFDALQDKFI